ELGGASGSARSAVARAGSGALLGASSRSGGVGTDDRGLEGGNDVVDARGGSLARALGKGALGAGADDGALRGGADGALRGGADGALRGGAEGALGGAEARPLGAGAEGRPWLAGRGGDELDAGTGVLRPTRAAGG